MANFLKDLIFNRGGFGASISRAETIERLNPLIEQHVKLNHQYTYVIRNHKSADIVTLLNGLQKTARADVGKLSEVVLSAGGVPYNGTDLEEHDFDLGDDQTEMLFKVQDAEEDFLNKMKDELDAVTHQMRTIALLEVVRNNSDERLRTMRSVTRPLTRRTTAS